ncbi:hypothetical protein ILUMI_07131 [Ignelater luminosus]|uniref:Integrase catalytic domain-containing protein n=1 Tax=Ignelater luminosus TaxID=2038154 RepID=A0A8K0D726_IGNLU|nr:hypothetical protein ILUMI_07131 [Ignelater luminosus]
MASTTFQSSVLLQCSVSIKILGRKYNQAVLLVLRNLCCDVLLGHDLLSQHSSINMQFSGSKSPLNVCGLATANVESASLFSHLTPDCKAICTKSRKFNPPDTAIINDEIQRMLKEDIIELSDSPWRAQVLVVTNSNHKHRMVIDYSQTINRYTLLDAYPLPNIEQIVNDVANYTVFSTIDLKNDVTVCGKDLEEHNKNLNKFLEAIGKYNLTINFQKSKFNQTKISLLGYIIENNSISSNPERLTARKTLKPPTDGPLLKRVLGMFSHYSNFIHKFLDKIKSIIATTVMTIDPEAPFTVETDASSFAVAATLSQLGRPVAFFSRTLSKIQLQQSSIEKEACAIVEALRKWRPPPTKTRNSYILTVIDEYSRFRFAIPCPDMTFPQLFNMFGTPAYIHSDRGSSFMSQEVKNFLTNGIASSRTTPHSPQGSGQAKRYNGIIWKTVQLTEEKQPYLLPPSVAENRSDPIETPPPSHEQDYIPSDPTPLQNSPAPTIKTLLPQNATTSQSITAPPPQNVAPRRSSKIWRFPAYLQDYHLGEG